MVAPYNPATYANHGTGLFFVGVEQTGRVYAYALDLTGNTFTRVASFASGFPSVMDLTYEPGSQKLWVVCDDTCGGRTAQFDVDGTGAFARTAIYERPAGDTANLNNEGFAITPQSECVNGTKPVFYADDTNDNGHSLRQGALSCVLPSITGAVSSASPKSASGWYPKPVTVTFTCSTHGFAVVGGCPTPVTLSAAGANQSVSRTITLTNGDSASVTVAGINVDPTGPTVKITGVKNGKTYPKKKKPKCKGSDALSGLASCTVVQKKKGSKVKVTATAVDNAGNVTTATLTYKIKKPKKK